MIIFCTYNLNNFQTILYTYFSLFINTKFYAMLNILIINILNEYIKYYGLKCQ